jgi:hypothetical protein
VSLGQHPMTDHIHPLGEGWNSHAHEWIAWASVLCVRPSADWPALRVGRAYGAK